MPFLIKTAPFEAASGASVTITEKMFFGGNKIAAGADVLIWSSETKGGLGLSWEGTVTRVELASTRLARVTVHLSAPRQSDRFGNTKLESFRNSRPGSPEAGLYKKMRSFSHDGIRELTVEEIALFPRIFLSRNEIGNFSRSEIDRMVRLGEVASRPKQKEFSEAIRQVYGGMCAITGCSTGEALQAAHIRLEKGRDDNSSRNGILLRADIHALF